MIEITAELQNGSRKSSTVEEACAVSLRCFILLVIPENVGLTGLE